MSSTLHPDLHGALDLLRDMIQVDSRTETPGEGELARRLVDRMRDTGLETELIPVSPGRFNAVGRLRGTGGGESLMFNGHLDTNPLTEGWTVDPWGGVTDDRFVYGLGVSNMKAGCASYLAAVETLLAHGTRLRGDVVLTFVVGELQGGVGTLKLIDEGLRADHFVNCEPTDLNALTLHAGSVDFSVELTGATRHLSKREEAVDAIMAACELIPRINTMTFGGAANAEHRSVNRANVGVIRGALSREFNETRPPQVADIVRLSGAARFAPSQNPEDVLGDIRSLIETELLPRFPGLGAQVGRHGPESGKPDFPPFAADLDSAVVRAVAAAHHEVRGTDQANGPLAPYCFYGSDAGHLMHSAGMSGVVCGPGGRYNTMPDERVDIVDYLDAVRMHIATMLRICGAADIADGHSGVAQP
ncbi:M20/M25/M40 family metallo-hydrolase [Streptomyces violaceusniger]|uniref:M20 family metallopeptidase n=1 Tax=Streptomyces violaceusniger TaxID=68280 RepID=UPI00343AC4DD